MPRNLVARAAGRAEGVGKVQRAVAVPEAQLAGALLQAGARHLHVRADRQAVGDVPVTLWRVRADRDGVNLNGAIQVDVDVEYL